MSETSAISPFQIIDWRILRFSCSNPILIIPADIEHHWMINAHIENFDAVDQKLSGIIQVEFSFFAEHDGKRMNMDGQCVAICEMDKTSVSDPDIVFQNLLSRTGMTNCLANLRVFLLQAGTLHQMGSRRIMLPFIDLNHFTFDEEIKFTT